MDEKKIIIKIQYLWFLCGILYIIPILIYLNLFITYVSKGIVNAFSQYGISVVTILISTFMIPIILYLGFVCISFVLVYLIKKEKYYVIKYSIIFPLISIAVFGVETFYNIRPIPSSIRYDSLLLLIIIGIIVLINVLIIYLSLKSRIQEIPT